MIDHTGPDWAPRRVRPTEVAGLIAILLMLLIFVGALIILGIAIGWSHVVWFVFGIAIGIFLRSVAP